MAKDSIGNQLAVGNEVLIRGTVASMLEDSVAQTGHVVIVSREKAPAYPDGSRINLQSYQVEKVADDAVSAEKATHAHVLELEKTVADLTQKNKDLSRAFDILLAEKKEAQDALEQLRRSPENTNAATVTAGTTSVTAPSGIAVVGGRTANLPGVPTGPVTIRPTETLPGTAAPPGPVEMVTVGTEAAPAAKAEATKEAGPGFKFGK